jgi:hypothetical protein
MRAHREEGRQALRGEGNACGILLWFAPTAIEQLNLVTISGNGGRVARSFLLFQRCFVKPLSQR